MSGRVPERQRLRPDALRSAWLLLVVLGILGISAPSRGQAPPVQEAPFQACPCWLGPEELVGEMRAIHSDISFICYLTETRSAIEIYARSSGVGGPFRSYVYATQPQGALDSTCRHFHQPQERFATRHPLRSRTQRSACVSIIRSAARLVGCQ